MKNYAAETAAKLYTELMDVWERKGIFSEPILWDSFTHHPDLASWRRRLECNQVLKDLAIYAVSISPTTGLAERNWSIHGFLQSKLRDRLTNVRLQKQVRLFQNLRVRDQILTGPPAYFADDEIDFDVDDDGVENVNIEEIEGYGIVRL